MQSGEEVNNNIKGLIFVCCICR